jgi:Sec-independent protein secretion pathway component TatC
MTLLYELGLLIARFYVPKPADEAENVDTQSAT